MHCNTPTVAWRCRGINPSTGKHYSPFKFFSNWKDLTLFNAPDKERIRRIVRQYNSCPPGAESVLLPCKHCLLCTRAYRRQWAFRLVSEARTSGESMYLTLTVDDSHLEEVFPSGRLSHRPFQLFMKRLRKKLAKGFSYVHVPPLTPLKLFGALPKNMEERFYQRKRISYYMCGEYGDLFGRPHYHACVFGARFPDAYFVKRVKGNAYYTSPVLKELWPYGEMTFFSDVTPASASYVAGYCDKKLDQHYWKLKHYLEHPEEDMPPEVAPEYVRMSQGIGLEYYERYKDDLYRLDANGDVYGEFFNVGHVPISAPSYFDKKLLLHDPERYGKIVAARERRRLSRIELMPVGVTLNESGRKHAVLVARRPCREVRES